MTSVTIIPEETQQVKLSFFKLIFLNESAMSPREKVGKSGTRGHGKAYKVTQVP